MIHLIKKMAFAMYLLLAGKIFRDPAALAPLARFRHLYYRTLYHQLLVELHEAVSRISPALSARLLDRRVMKHADLPESCDRIFTKKPAPAGFFVSAAGGLTPSRSMASIKLLLSER